MAAVPPAPDPAQGGDGGPSEARRSLVLDFCLRLGDLLLASGAGAADVTATMIDVAEALGLRGVDVDITFTSLRITDQPRPDVPPLIATRMVRRRVIDYQDLTRVDHLVRDVGRGAVGLEEGRAQLRRITSTGHDRRRWAVSCGWGAMAGGVAISLGGDVLVVLVAMLSAVLIDRLQLRMARRRLPTFYLQVAGGGVASLVAVGASAAGRGLDHPVDVSLVVTANIVMLLSGIGFMGALQDALTGFYITAGARLTEALLSTAGIIAGVSGGISLGSAVHVDLPELVPGQTGIAGLGTHVLGAAVAASAFAFASYSPKRALAPIAVVAALAMLISRSIEAPGITGTWAVAFAALFVGLVGYTVASRLKVPPLIVVVSAVTPLLPGISIYKGLSLVSEGVRRDTSLGVVAIISAASVALALAAGVILGQYLAQPLDRVNARREFRLAGPRLVGPLRIPRRRARDLRRRAGTGRPPSTAGHRPRGVRVSPGSPSGGSGEASVRTHDQRSSSANQR
jgi:uncharacterized membrane protein YjjP (DUF1212 family)